MVRSKLFHLLLVLVFIASSCIFSTGCSLTSLEQTGALIGLQSSDSQDPADSTVQSGPTPVYISVVIHFEESFPQDAETFARARQELIDFAVFCNKNDITYNFQPDWAFMASMQKNETPEMLASTGGKNILLYLVEDLKQEVDPHSHEHEYNYADVAYLIDSFGVKPSNIGGGLISYPADKCQLDRFLQPFQGNVYDFKWKADYIWGGGTGGHIDEPLVSGIWWPKSTDEFYVNADGATIPSIGKYTGEISDIYALAEQIQNGQAPAGHLYTAAIMVNQPDIRQDMAEMEQEMNRLKSMQDQGQIQFASLQTLIQHWTNDWDSKGYVFQDGSRNLNKTNKDRQKPNNMDPKSGPQALNTDPSTLNQPADRAARIDGQAPPGRKKPALANPGNKARKTGKKPGYPESSL